VILQTFSLLAPTAQLVQLVGDFTQWQHKPIRMEKAAGATWQAGVELAPGEHRYRFIVDGQWQDDPECKMHVPNPYGGQDALRQVT
jgi:1,4-alpha-glucan branching enzyme